VIFLDAIKKQKFGFLAAEIEQSQAALGDFVRRNPNFSADAFQLTQHSNLQSRVSKALLLVTGTFYLRFIQ
jgi:uncharacterized protein YxjI